MDTKAVLDHHIAALASGDLEGVLADYTEESVLMMADSTARGLDELRATFGGLMDGLFAPGTYEFTMDRVDVCGEVAYIVWHAACADADIRLGTDTFVVRDGKIAVQTFAAAIDAH